MSLVIDASITLAWYFTDEITPVAEAVLDRVAEAGAVVPGHWRLEVANALQSARRRKRVSGVYRDKSLAELARLPITVDPYTNTHAWTSTLELADDFALTAYDAAYVELARRRNLPLATLDTQMRQAATGLGIPLLGVVP
jgi:predicted nucleic acid-binding protein